jgi:hypothetical protein
VPPRRLPPRTAAPPPRAADRRIAGRSRRSAKGALLPLFFARAASPSSWSTAGWAGRIQPSRTVRSHVFILD